MHIQVARLHLSWQCLGGFAHDHQRHLDRIAGLCVTFEFFEAHAVDPGADESDVVQDVPKPPRGIFAGHLENADRVARGARARKWLQPSRRDQIDRAADDLG